MEKNIVAIMYDFDKTLSTKDMQEYSFIPSLGLTSSEFWNQANEVRNNSEMDQILSCLYTMYKGALDKGIPLTRNYLKDMGKNIELYPGVETWFERINEYGKNHDLEIEHYIISSGSKEIIEGTNIGNKFKKIFASEFYYDETGKAVWPKLAINYTNKTQYLMRINKGILNILDDNSLNKKMDDSNKRIPFSNMIYIGDGLTDVPCMKLTHELGGNSIAVYTEENVDNANTLLNDKRINFAVKADYSENSKLDIIMKNIINNIAIKNELEKLSK